MIGGLVRLGCVAGLTGLAGCADYLSRSDTIAPGAGDSIAQNAAIQTVDPWPRRAFDPRLPGDGARLSVAVGRYRAGAPLGPAKGGDQAASPTASAATGAN
jgi:hypothetical protein